jgi:hypothetical protein
MLRIKTMLRAKIVTMENILSQNSTGTRSNFSIVVSANRSMVLK